MPTYQQLNATFDELIINEDDLKYGKAPYKFFILVNAYDEELKKYVKYQIKFNEHKQRHNINEFISHFVGSCSDMPLLNGAFLELDDDDIDAIQKEIDRHGKGHLKSIDFSSTNSNQFFGVEWMQNITKIDDERELIMRVGETSNRKSFYGLYAFDQFMKNYDRHLGNHLVVKVGNSKKYKLIDFDRVFSSTNWSRVASDYTCFTPFVCTSHAKRYHGFLMHIVNDKSIKLVHTYAGKLQGIDTKDIKGLCDIISIIYNVTSLEILNIFRWIEYRKQEIVMKCFMNEKHFPNIKKGLYSVS